MLVTQLRDAAKEALGPWWTFLIAGVAWFVISVIVLQLNLRSVGTVGVLLGVIFLVSALEEFFVASVTGGWGWARALPGGEPGPSRGRVEVPAQAVHDG